MYATNAKIAIAPHNGNIILVSLPIQNRLKSNVLFFTSFHTLPPTRNPDNAKKAEALQLFAGEFATEEEMAARIRSLYEAEGYILDPHTAVAAAAYEKYRARTGDETMTVIASTASPYKFTRAVLTAIDRKKYAGMKDFDLFAELEKLSNVPIPRAIEDILKAPVKHDTVCDKDKLIEEIEKIYLG